MKGIEFKSERMGTTENNQKAEKIRLNKLLKEISSQNFYARLGVEKGAKKEEINDAFRKKAKEFHPDTKPGELRDLYDQIMRLYSEARVVLVGENGADQGNGAGLDPFSQWREFLDPKAREDRRKTREAQLVKENPEIAKRATRYGISMEDMIFRKGDVEAAEKAKEIILAGKVAVIVEYCGAYYPSGSYLDEEISTSHSEVFGFNSQKEAEEYMNKNSEPTRRYENDAEGPGTYLVDSLRYLHMVLPGKKLFSYDQRHIDKMGAGGHLIQSIPDGYYLVELTEEGRIGVPKDQLRKPVKNDWRKLINTRESLLLRVIKSEDILRLNNHKK